MKGILGTKLGMTQVFDPDTEDDRRHRHPGVDRVPWSR